MNEKDIILLLGRLEGKLDSISQQNISQIAKINEMDKRLQNLEKYRAWLIGVSSGVAAIVSWLLHVFKTS